MVGTIISGNDGGRQLCRFAVAGGRDFRGIELVRHALSQMPDSATLIHGCATGADTLAAEFWAGVHGRKMEEHPADWGGRCHSTCRDDHRKQRWDGSDYCPAAGFYRNQEMVDSGLDLLIAFPGGAGTSDMVIRCMSAGIAILDLRAFG